MLPNLKKHWRYTKYVLRHKWYVLNYCVKLGIPWRGIVHDLSKHLPNEWYPYAEFYYGPNSKNENRHAGDYERYLHAWNSHQKRNKHHWQYYILVKDDGTILTLDMPFVYVKEMVGDWLGAGKALNGKNDVMNWYKERRETMRMSTKTRLKLEALLTIVQDWE